MKGSGDGQFDLVAARYLFKQVKELKKQMSGCLKCEDIEYIHQTRVALRRILQGLRFFESVFGAKKIKRWNKHLRQARRKLGSPRNLDVQILALKEILDNLKEDQTAKLKPGIERVILRMAQKRAKQQQKVSSVVEDLQSAGVIGQIKNVCIGIRKKPNPDAAAVSEQTIRNMNHVNRRLIDKTLAYDGVLDDKDASSEHHQLRIVVKKLRYTIEICSLLDEPRFKDAIESLKELQDVLGQLHDFDEWLGLLEEFEKVERKRTEQYFGDDQPYGQIAMGVDYLKGYFRRKRLSAIKSGGQKWRELMDQCLLQSMIVME